MSQLTEVLQTRLDYAQSATKKYNAVARTELNGRLYNTLQMNGASRTNRWAGRVFQMQNLKRPTMKPKEAEAAAQLLSERPQVFGMLYSLEDLGGLVRSAIRAPEGYRLVVSDLSAIESRVLGWMTDCRWINEVFAEGKDTYKAFAQMWLGIPYEQVDKATRTLCKPPFLGFGYGIGATRLKDYAEAMGVELTEDQCESAIKTARQVCHQVPAFWRMIEAGFRAAIMGNEAEVGLFTLRREGRFVTVEVPNGSKLYYDDPQWRPGDDPEYPGCSYMGQNQYTGQWERLRTWGGKLCENLDQKIARDILVEGLRRYRTFGGTIVGHVHDEIIALEPAWCADVRLAQLNEALSAPISWAPGLKLDSAGYIATRYRKD